VGGGARGGLAGGGDQGGWAGARRGFGSVVLPGLGDGGRTPLLLVDPADRAYWADGNDIQPAPIEIDATGPSLARWFDAAPALTSRELTVADGRGYWLLQRYENDLLLFGGARDRATLAIEPIVDLFVRCPDVAWADRIASLFIAARPFVGVETDGFEEGTATWIREYAGDVDHLRARDVPWLGMLGSEVVGARTPSPPRELSPKRRAPTLPSLTRCSSTFDVEERTLFERGYFLARLHRKP